MPHESDEREFTYRSRTALTLLSKLGDGSLVVVDLKREFIDMLAEFSATAALASDCAIVQSACAHPTSNVYVSVPLFLADYWRQQLRNRRSEGS